MTKSISPRVATCCSPTGDNKLQGETAIKMFQNPFQNVVLFWLHMSWIGIFNKSLKSLQSPSPSDSHVSRGIVLVRLWCEVSAWCIIETPCLMGEHGAGKSECRYQSPSDDQVLSVPPSIHRVTSPLDHRRRLSAIRPETHQTVLEGRCRRGPHQSGRPDESSE